VWKQWRNISWSWWYVSRNKLNSHFWLICSWKMSFLHKQCFLLMRRRFIHIRRRFIFAYYCQIFSVCVSSRCVRCVLCVRCVKPCMACVAYVACIRWKVCFKLGLNFCTELKSLCLWLLHTHHLFISKTELNHNKLVYSAILQFFSCQNNSYTLFFVVKQLRNICCTSGQWNEVQIVNINWVVDLRFSQKPSIRPKLISFFRLAHWFVKKYIPAMSKCTFDGLVWWLSKQESHSSGCMCTCRYGLLLVFDLQEMYMCYTSMYVVMQWKWCLRLRRLNFMYF